MFASGRCSCSQLELLHKGYKVNSTVRQCAVTRKSDLSIKIPQRIERGPTDILKALSATVKNHLSIPYKYPDDPFFYPSSNLEKRQLALALESGRKSARYIFENHPKFFKAKIADPLIEAYMHKPVYTEESEVTEDTLVSIIKKRYVQDAQTVYDILISKGIEISKDTKQLLLELVCFYNGNEVPPTEELEFKWFMSRRESTTFKTWKDNGFAEKLFNSMETDCPFAISAIILGRLKYNQIENGTKLFEHALKNNIKLPVEVYNEILSKAGFIINGRFHDLRLYIEKILKEMESKGVKPDLSTLNAILETLFKAQFTDRMFSFMWEVFDEITRLGIKPSLGTYYYLFNILIKKEYFRDEANKFVNKTLKDLHEEKLELRHPSDFKFFPGVMLLICAKLKKPQLSDLLNGLLIKDDNFKFLSWNVDENFYYRNYFLVHFKYDTIENAMKLYESFVPWKYSPELMVYECILNTIYNEGALEFLPKIWEDLKEVRLIKQGSILEMIMDMVLLCDENKSEALKVLSKAADLTLSLFNKENWNGFTKIRNMDSFTSNILITYVKNKEVSKAHSVFKRITNEDNMLSVTSGALKIYFNYCLSEENHSMVLEILSYADGIKLPEAPSWAAQSLPKLQKLSPEKMKWVSKLAEKSSQTEPAEPKHQAIVPSLKK